ncbi:MAG: hypothetical protein IT210_00885 [Armatimonadetes bacterium]|nr:hypothetical protein [Armatimonadota bacterium]
MNHKRLSIYLKNVFAGPALCLLAVCFLSGLPAPVQAQRGDRLWRLLEKRDWASRQVGFTGIQMTTARTQQDVISLTQITHRRPDLTLIRYKAPEFLAGMMVLDNGQESLHYIPGKPFLMAVSSRFNPARMDMYTYNTRLFRANYRLSWGGKQIVGNRQCLVIEVKPRYPGNPRRKLWLDTETGLEMKTERYDSGGRLSMTTRFVEIAFRDTISDEEVSLPEKARFLNRVQRPDTPLDLARSQEVVGFQAMMPQYLPQGYAFYEASAIRTGRRNMAHLMFSDGMNTISLFEHIASERRNRKHSPRNPWLGLSARMKSWKAGNLRLMLISDLPQSELDKIAASVAPAP